MKCKAIVLTLMSLLATGCNTGIIDGTDPHPNGTPVAASSTTGTHIAAGNDCNAQAKNKLSLFEKPDTYPISDAEKNNAYKALYDECMRGNTQIATGPKPDFDVAAANTNYAAISPAAGGNNFAALSPAAGGNMPARTGVTVANGVTVIDTAQFANLNPAAGGISTGTSPNGSTVVVVQATPNGAMAVPAAAAAPVPTHAAAIPVTPVGAQAANAPPVATMETKTTTTTTTEKTVAANDAEEKPKTRKTSRAKSVKTTDTAANPNDKRTRFARNAIPVTNLSAYQPSAGSLVDNAVTSNLPAQKD